MTLATASSRLLGIAILASQILSPVLFIPGLGDWGGSVFRVLLVAVAAILLITRGVHDLSEPIRKVLVVGIFLVAWQIIGMSWSISLSGAFRQISYIATLLLTIYVFNCLASTPREFKFFALAYTVLGVIIFLASLYELETGDHFTRSSLQDLAESDLSMQYVSQDQAWFTFGNPNDLAVHLALSFFIMTLLSWVRNSGFGWAFGAVFLGGAVFMVEKLDARIAIVAVVGFALVSLLARRQSKPVSNATVAYLGLAGGATILLAAIVFVDRAEFLDVSTFVRLKLISHAIEMATDTVMVGVGTGAFEIEMWYGGFVGSTYGIVNPHNALTRILAENGILGAILFGYLLFGPLRFVLRAREVNEYTAFVTATSLGLPLLLSVGSDPISASSLQISFAFLWIACRYAQGAKAPASVAPPMQQGARRVQTA